MSAIDIPPRLLSAARAKRIRDPEEQWRAFVEVNGGVPAKNLDARFLAWLENAPRLPPPELQKPEVVPTMYRAWQEPPDWREARRLAKAGKVDNAREAQTILDMLRGMGPRPREAGLGTTIATENDSRAAPDPETPKEGAC